MYVIDATHVRVLVSVGTICSTKQHKNAGELSLSFVVSRVSYFEPKLNSFVIFTELKKIIYLLRFG